MNNIFMKVGLLLDCTGADPLKNKSVYVQNGVITKIGDINDEIPEDAEVFDFSDYVVMPGLINSHVHIHGFYPYNNLSDPELYNFEVLDRTLHCIKILDAFLKSGVTYVRSLGAKDYFDIKMRNAIAKGLTEKIGIVAAGPFITMTGGHAFNSGIEVDGADECRKVARTIIKNGADVLKVMATGGVLSKGMQVGCSQLTVEEMSAVTEEAHKVGIKVAAHAQGLEGIKNAVIAGVDSIEHGCVLSDEIINMMIEKNTYLVPTFCATNAILSNSSSKTIPAYSLHKAQIVEKEHNKWVKKAYEAGVKIASGTDSSTPFNSPENTWQEIKLLRDCGISAMDSMLAATKNAADLLGISNLYGTIEENKMADIIVLKENPLSKVETLSNVLKVFKEGKEIK